MRPIYAAVLVTFFLTAATHAGAKERTRYLELINRAHDSVTSVALAVAGDDAFRTMPLGGPLRGGGGSTTIEIAGDHCLYDVRFLFRNGRALIHRNVDICRHRGLRIRPLPPAAENGQFLAGRTLAHSGNEHAPHRSGI